MLEKRRKPQKLQRGYIVSTRIRNGKALLPILPTIDLMRRWISHVSGFVGLLDVIMRVS